MSSSFTIFYFLHCVLLFGAVYSLLKQTIRASQTRKIISTNSRTTCNAASWGGESWGDFELHKPRIIGPAAVFRHWGDLNLDVEVDPSAETKAKFNLNVGKAMETLRRELPMIFYVTNVDFSIFAPTITILDSNQNKIVIQKNLYAAAVKSLRMATALSSLSPSMNVRSIEYIEDLRTIQCRVDVVLPDTVRVEGQAVWEGLFYFGLNHEGLIDTHIFDRKISNFKPSPPANARAYPWFRVANSIWKGQEQLAPSPVPIPAYATLADQIIESLSSEPVRSDVSDDEINPLVLQLLQQR